MNWYVPFLLLFLWFQRIDTTRFEQCCRLPITNMVFQDQKIEILGAFGSNQWRKIKRLKAGNIEENMVQKKGWNIEAEGFRPLAFWSSSLPGDNVHLQEVLQFYLSPLGSLKGCGLSEYKKTAPNNVMEFSHLFGIIYAETICTMAIAIHFL